MAARVQFQGAYTALITPFTADGAVDYAAYERIINFQIDNGIDGLVPIGTTGESPSLSEEEQRKVIECCVRVVAGRVPVIAGAGSNCTVKTVKAVQFAKDAGVTAALVVNPYYNKPNQEGLYQHFKKVCEVGLPIMLYNIPGRCGIQMTPQTVARLYNDFPEIVAIKEATGSLDMASEIASLCPICIMSGDDTLTLPLMSVGARGVVSVLSNCAPHLVKAITTPALAGDWKKARVAHLSTFKIFKTMFIEPNPQPVKQAMKLVGLCESYCRLPMVQCSAETSATVKAVLEEYEVVQSKS